MSTATKASPDHPLEQGRRPGGVSWALIATSAALIAFALLQGRLAGVLKGSDAWSTWLTVLIGLTVQALPFLVLGVVLSAAIAVLVPASVFSRWIPRSPALSVPAASCMGVVLPGCECASVPVASALMGRGVRPAAALTFLLAAPAVNPIVVVSTAVAFPGQPVVVVARVLTSMLVAVIVGWVWLTLGKDTLIRMPKRSHAGESRLEAFISEVLHDVLHAGGWLVIGAAVAATVHVFAPVGLLEAVGSNLAVSIVALAIFAFVIAVCSEADAFVAASMTQFPLTARLAFMAVGPVLDVKLLAMQWGTFGPRFTRLFAPLSLLVAVAVATVVGTVLL